MDNSIKENTEKFLVGSILHTCGLASNVLSDKEIMAILLALMQGIAEGMHRKPVNTKKSL